MSARLRRVISSGDSGASAVEYGLLVAGIAALIVGIVFVFGTFVTGIFEETCTEIGSAAREGNSEITLPTCPGAPGTS
ncbi:Flp family type IVb pilin [Aquipuribacter sp. MA13-6]|uniref:Flp family type IVb pilin n=1 Tax=unclassified Aquipuribacter TaxID=2635084 RepID=UPI003EED8460